ncbi:HNH endonuclease [Marinobacter sp. R17]|uniref:HNH endonuclease family protein n=1 Tax=Marinobacter sp. R17 TaxID=2484250 RepID=UPI000F4C99D8|nr:HNH endonuclease family protein [Marinobacter sp. R17]ROT94366.1 HNH endonuclease [Marinobacter sp. R17]
MTTIAPSTIFCPLRAFLFLLAISGFPNTGTASPSNLVKQSTSGICHTKQSPYYGRIKHYKGFESLSSCIENGGRLTQYRRVNTARSSRSSVESDGSGYQRAAFGSGWDDADGDCQDSRTEALIHASITSVRFATERRCRVVTGRWISPFTGQVIQNSSNIDIDHVVPLAWAWRHGASQWSSFERQEFANDTFNLWPVEASLNRSKGAKGPNDWLPPGGKCQYVARFVRIVSKYSLQFSTQEQNGWNRLRASCRQ